MRFLALCLVMAAEVSAQSFSSSDAADAAERLNGRRAHMDGGILRIAGGRVSGPAVTMQLTRDDRASLADEGLKAIRVVEEAARGAVIVVCSDSTKDHAIFGATFAALAKSRGLGGFVIDGAMRGRVTLERIGVPVFARGTVPGSAGGHYRLTSVNRPVTCAGVTISPGDLIVGDEDGVAVIPRAIAELARARATDLRREKDEMLPLIARYQSYTRALAVYREQQARKAARPNQSP